MKKRNKIILLILTLLPIFIIPILVFWVIAGGIQMSSMADPEKATPFFVTGIILMGILVVLASLGTWIYFLVHALKNQRIDSNERLIWVLLFIFVAFISQIIYFFMHIWDLPEPEVGLKKV